MNPHLPAPTPPSTNSSGASPENAQFRVVRKRNRIPLSCAPCRHRKLKCNRSHPCDNCTKRGDTASCAYASTSTRKRAGAGVGANGGPDNMQNRIDRLESLVLSLMTTGGSTTAATAQAAISNARNNSTSGTSQSIDNSVDQDMDEDQDEDSDVNTVRQGLDVMKVAEGKSVYVSEAHWYAIMANIAEVRKFHAENVDEYKAQVRKVEAAQDDDAPGGILLFKAPRFNSREEAMQAFPNKQQTDLLIGRYWNSYDPSVHIIHGPTFQKQYDAHWRNPTETPLPFIAIMYGMMALALQSYNRAGDEPQEYIGRSLKLSVVFRRLTAQTLILADIRDPASQLLEALVLHAQAEYGRSRDTESGILVLVSLIVRLAMRMGYHRDAAPHPNISPFQAEMRRRVWMMIRQSDLLFSFQAGLPSVSRIDCMDTKLPSNLFDDELHEDMIQLPPSRPVNEPTPMSYMIAKARLSQVFGRITDRLCSINSPPSYDEITDIDKELKDVRANLPPHLHIRPLHESVNEPANIIMQRYGLELLYLKSQCVLHRRFISRGRETQRYAYSRRTCIDASMDMLTHQAMLHHESQPGGRLHSVKWYISSLTTHDFLLAAMIVCLELHHLAEAEKSVKKPGSTPSSPMNDFVDERRDEMLAALRHSMVIWESLRDRSMEAWKASTTLRIMIEKLLAQRNGKTEYHGSSSMLGGGSYPVPGNTNSNNLGPMGVAQSGRAYPLSYGLASFGAASMSSEEDQRVPAEQAAAMTLGLLSSGGVSPNGGGGGGGNMNGGSVGVQAEGKPPYSVSMAGIMSEPVPETGRTGLTPSYSGPMEGSSPYGGGLYGQAGSVFDGLAQGGGGGGGTEIDWGAWDSFVQGASMEPISTWSTMVPDPTHPAGVTSTPGPVIDPAIEGAGSTTTTTTTTMTAATTRQTPLQQQQQQQGSGDGSSNGNVNSSSGGGGSTAAATTTATTATAFMGAPSPNPGAWQQWLVGREEK